MWEVSFNASVGGGRKGAGFSSRAQFGDFGVERVVARVRKTVTTGTRSDANSVAPSIDLEEDNRETAEVDVVSLQCLRL
jgi:hypothetical protein